MAGAREFSGLGAVSGPSPSSSRSVGTASRRAALTSRDEPQSSSVADDDL